MKYIFSLLMIFSSYLSFGQMTVSDMVKINSMDMDELESYSLGKGFTFHRIEDNVNYKGHVYTKGKGDDTKYLTLYSEYFDKGKYVSYQTSNSNELLKIKNQMKNIGFVLYNEKTFEGALVKDYKNNKYNLRLISEKNFFTISLSKN
jgi:hypothetical protein